MTNWRVDFITTKNLLKRHTSVEGGIYYDGKHNENNGNC